MPSPFADDWKKGRFARDVFIVELILIPPTAPRKKLPVCRSHFLLRNILAPSSLVDALPSDAGLTTDRRVVQAIVELCGRVNPSDVTIAEGSGGADTTIVFERCGYSELREDITLSAWT